MVSEEKIMNYLKQNLSEGRLKHSVEVSRTAEALAGQYGSDTEKAGLAGLVHDCARYKSREELVQYIAEEGIMLDEAALCIKELLHGPAAVHICKKEFGIYDGEVLSAVMYHTTGKENMTKLEKIIFLADFIEPGRVFDGVEELRRLALENLDEALLAAFDSSIKYIISKRGHIHKTTVAARNYLLQSMELQM